MHFLEETTTESPEEVIKEPDENGPLIILAAFIILCVGAIVKQFCIWSKAYFTFLEKSWRENRFGIKFLSSKIFKKLNKEFLKI